MREFLRQLFCTHAFSEWKAINDFVYFNPSLRRGGIWVDDKRTCIRCHKVEYR